VFHKAELSYIQRLWAFKKPLDTLHCGIQAGVVHSEALSLQAFQELVKYWNNHKSGFQDFVATAYLDDTSLARRLCRFFKVPEDLHVLLTYTHGVMDITPVPNSMKTLAERMKAQQERTTHRS
jgi:hypothetical protein